MGTLTHKAGSIPTIEWVKAVWSWLVVAAPYFIGWSLTFVLGIFVAITSRKAESHPQMKPLTSTHKAQYITAGSSGAWEYWNSPYAILRWWNNYEDGTLGEPSGKHSARVGGGERSVWNQYMWTIRNPFNWAKRTLPLFHCPVDDCDIEYWGDFKLTDKVSDGAGWHFIKARHRVSGRVYYYYRSVKPAGVGYVRQAAIGFKLKPEHALHLQDADDKDKAFTVRLPVKTRID